MEILALLFLGLIAMLAVVPPIIRGKLDESPLVTTQTFQRSMQEIAHSLDPQFNRPSARGNPRGSLSSRPKKNLSAGIRREFGRPSRRRAAIRRNRILASLTILTLGWGAATLFSGKMWCLVVFTVSGCLLAIYWGLTLVIPYLTIQTERGRLERGVTRGAGRRIA